MPTRTITIEHRFHGPPDSGNGGYVCGRLADFIDGDATVRLNVPPPLETELQVRDTAGGVELVHGDTTVAQGRTTDLDIDIEDPPAFEEAVEASKLYPGFTEHMFPTCFVCGPEREAEDGLCIFPGPVNGRSLVAAPWVPDLSLCDESGVVREHFIWAALDCPGAFAFSRRDGAWTVLGELAVHLDASVRRDERCVLSAWHLGSQGRKHYAATVLYSEQGEPTAVSKATWIEVRR